MTYYVEWVLGATRDRSQAFVVPEFDPASEALLARNSWNEDFAGRVAFVAASEKLHGLTADRTEFLGRHGSYATPAALGRIGLASAVRPGLDPCAALQLHLDLAPGATARVHFMLGQAAGRDEALGLVTKYRDRSTVEAAWADLHRHWDALLGAVTVRTPDPALDLMLNRWLPYQVLSSRLWGRTGYYQSSGAFGFRDQLQDVAALVHCAPADLPGPYPRGGAPPVRGGGRPALVASAGGSRGANAVLGRPPVAPVHHGALRRGDRRRDDPVRGGAVPGGRAARAATRSSATRASSPASAARRSTGTAWRRSSAAARRARTGCRCSGAATGTTG